MFTRPFPVTCYVIFKDHEEYSHSTGKSSRQFKIIHLKRFMFPEHRIFYIIYLYERVNIKFSNKSSFYLHFTQDHSTDFFSRKSFLLSFHIYSDMGFLVLFDHFEWKVLQVALNWFVVPCSADQSFGVKNSVLWIRCQLIFRSIADQSLAFRSESHVRRSDSVSLLVCDDFNSTVLKYTNTVKYKNKRWFSSMF